MFNHIIKGLTPFYNQSPDPISFFVENVLLNALSNIPIWIRNIKNFQKSLLFEGG